MNIDFHNGYISFYNETYYDSITPMFNQNDFDFRVDSFFVYVHVNDNWEGINLSEFWSLDNWWTNNFSDDNTLCYYYFFSITDSLINKYMAY